MLWSQEAEIEIFERLESELSRTFYLRHRNTDCLSTQEALLSTSFLFSTHVFLSMLYRISKQDHEVLKNTARNLNKSSAYVQKYHTKQQYTKCTTQFTHHYFNSLGANQAVARTKVESVFFGACEGCVGRGSIIVVDVHVVQRLAEKTQRLLRKKKQENGDLNAMEKFTSNLSGVFPWALRTLASRN